MMQLLFPISGLYFNFMGFLMYLIFMQSKLSSVKCFFPCFKRPFLTWGWIKYQLHLFVWDRFKLHYFPQEVEQSFQHSYGNKPPLPVGYIFSVLGTDPHLYLPVAMWCPFLFSLFSAERNRSLSGLWVKQHRITLVLTSL